MIVTSINISIIISLNAAKCSDIVYKCDPTHPQALSHLFRFNKSLPMPPNWTRVKKSLRGYWSRKPLEMACFFRPLHAPLMTNFMIVWLVNHCCQVFRHSLFASSLSFAPSNKIQQPKIWVISELDRCNIYCMDKIFSNLVFLRNLQQLSANYGYPCQVIFVMTW